MKRTSHLQDTSSSFESNVHIPFSSIPSSKGSGRGRGSGTGPPGLNEDVDNPGNQLLRRLGWKEGEGLGRGGSGDVESVATKLEQKHAGAGPGSVSVKRGVGISSSPQIPAVEYGAGSEYKNSILRAARARYDQIDKSTS